MLQNISNLRYRVHRPSLLSVPLYSHTSFLSMMNSTHPRHKCDKRRFQPFKRLRHSHSTSMSNTASTAPPTLIKISFVNSFPTQDLTARRPRNQQVILNHCHVLLLLTKPSFGHEFFAALAEDVRVEVHEVRVRIDSWCRLGC